MAHEEDLAKVWIFSKLEKSDLERIGKVVVSRSYKAGEEIVNEGEQAVAFYVIVKGKVEVTKGGAALNTLSAGDGFGEMALLDGYPRVASVRAAADTDCLVMTRWDFAAELRTNPTIALAMLPVMSKRIRELEGDTVH
jgi:CRP/FNR family transcriptional regulator, cyclic AMP receptor protein